MVTLVARRCTVLAVLMVVPLALSSVDASATPALDISFGGGVITPKVFPKGKSTQVARSAVIQTDGKVLVPMALSVKYGRSGERPVLRYRADGTIDRSYGKNGASWFGVSGEKYVGFTGLSLQDDGKALVYGGASNSRLSSDTDFVARLTRAGKLDRSFGRNGMTRLSSGGTWTRAIIGTFPLKDGRTIVAFEQSFAGAKTVDFIRLKKDGRLDRSYADHRIKLIYVSISKEDPIISDVEVVGDDAFVLVSPDVDSTGAPCKLIRAKISSSGGRVKNFGNNGTVTLATFKPKDALSCRQLTPTSDGGVVVVGSVYFNEFDGTSAGVAYKLRADGSRDPSFGVGGKVQAPDEFELAGAAELDSGGYLAVGERGDSGSAKGPLGGTAAILSPQGGLQDLLAGGVLPKTRTSYLDNFDHRAAGSVALYTRYGERGPLGSHIVKFTN